MSKLKYITTPIFYANGNPHIGHAYTAVAADTIARFERLDSQRVLFISGTDEHGLKMVQTAAASGVPVLELANHNSQLFQNMLRVLNVSNDDFVRTTEQRHRVACEEIWRLLLKNDDIYLDKYAGWYSVRQEAFFSEDETHIGDDEKRYESLGSEVEWIEEESYFFCLSKYQEQLLKHYEEQPNFFFPSQRRPEIVNFVRSGLSDISISRTSISWGIKVPDDAHHVMYVWIDALTNYLTCVGFPSKEHPRAHFWPANVHVIGKDILRFHAVFWPAFLMAANLKLPETIAAHGFLLNSGEKMSKSVGNVVDPFPLVDEYGADSVRYYLLRETPFGQDGSFSHEALVKRINSDLANDLGNLAQRVLIMISKYCGGKIPTPSILANPDKEILDAADRLYAESRKAMDTFGIHIKLRLISLLTSQANRYFTSQEPWVSLKIDLPRCETVLYVTIEVLRQIAVLLQAAMPESAAKLLDLLSVDQEHRTFAALGQNGRLRAGVLLPTPSIVFPRYVAKP